MAYNFDPMSEQMRLYEALRQAGALDPTAADVLSNQQYRANADQLAAAMRAQQNAYRQPTPRSPFNGAEVIDLVQGPDGAWRVPVHLEHRMREP